MHDDRKPYIPVPDDAFIVWWSGPWIFLFSRSEKRLYIYASEYKPLPLHLDLDELLFLQDVIENWDDERQQEANQLLEKGADLGVKFELAIARAGTRHLFDNARMQISMPGQPGYEEARKRREEREKREQGGF